MAMGHTPAAVPDVAGAFRSRGHILATISRPPQITLVNYCYVFQQLERDLGR